MRLRPTERQVKPRPGWLSRDRRIKLGKRVLNACLKSEATGEPEYFTHFQKSRGTVAVYLVSDEARKERLNQLDFLVTYAHFKYQVKQAFGVATDAGVSGRSYDFIMTRKQLQPENIAYLKTLPDPFTDEHSHSLFVHRWRRLVGCLVTLI
ncbi:MAG TPA: hypothetical protein VM912_15230 [Terriglobales bacterium]|nr:hypothetical protein [Terriglobales bacterium]